MTTIPTEPVPTIWGLFGEFVQIQKDVIHLPVSPALCIIIFISFQKSSKENGQNCIHLCKFHAHHLIKPALHAVTKMKERMRRRERDHMFLKNLL